MAAYSLITKITLLDSVVGPLTYYILYMWTLAILPFYIFFCCNTALKLIVISVFNIFFSCSLDMRLESWHDPTPRESEFTVQDLHEACVEALSHDYNYFPFSEIKPSEEERQEHDRKSSVIALGVYAKQNNMQVTPISINNQRSGYSYTTVLGIIATPF
jgi:hypothetical protein